MPRAKIVRWSSIRVAVIECAYSPCVDDHAWLESVCEATARLFGERQSVLAVVLDRTRGPTPFAQAVANPSRGAAVAGAVFRERVLASGTLRDRFDVGPVTSLRRTIAGKDVVDRLAAVGIEDSLFVLAGDLQNAMCVLAIPLASRARLPRHKKHALTCIAAHISSGARLRIPATSGEPQADAIITPNGRVDHAEPRVQVGGGLELLRTAALAAERSRGTLRRSAPEEAVELWRALVDGRWSLVDRFDSDGKRFIVARRNEPRAVALRTLTSRETYVASLVARGHSNKLIAYELGLSEATIATHVARAKSKLGVRSRVELASVMPVGPPAL